MSKDKDSEELQLAFFETLAAIQRRVKRKYGSDDLSYISSNYNLYKSQMSFSEEVTGIERIIKGAVEDMYEENPELFERLSGIKEVKRKSGFSRISFGKYSVDIDKDRQKETQLLITDIGNKFASELGQEEKNLQ